MTLSTPAPLRRRAYLGLAAAAGLILGGGYLAATRHQATPMLIGGPFRLVDADGHVVTDRSFRGRFMLVYFGYTFCPDVCPTTLTNVAEALDLLGPKADRIQPIFITIDPRRDTAAVVKQYAATFSSRLVGLTGSPEEIADAARAYRVFYAPHQTGPGPEDYSMDHSSILYLMGPDGSFVAVIPRRCLGAEMAAQLSRLVS